MSSFVDRSGEIWQQATTIWASGGWGMIAIAVVAVALYGLGVHVHLRLGRRGFDSVPEKVWRPWIDRPSEREGRIGRLMEYLAGGETIEETAALFRQVVSAELTPFERDLRVMKVCVSAAPLVGLLGTVTGMLATFAALSGGGGGDQTMGLVAEGISQALITTETGLVMALPGLFYHYYLNRKFEGYRAFLAHLESVCNQRHFASQARRTRDAVNATSRMEPRMDLVAS